jgi:hypothetical protein
MVNNSELCKDLYVYLIRHHRVFFPTNKLFNSNKPHVVVDDRYFQIEGNKKYLKKKIYNLIENEKPEFIEGEENIANTHKTIKYFLQESNKIKKQ